MRRALLPTLAFVGTFAVLQAPAFAQCTATRDCGGGTPVQCQGTTSCQAVSNGVECDGVQTTCSSSPAACYMEYYCPNGFIFWCSGTNTCSVNMSSHTITCDQTGPNPYPGGQANTPSSGLTTYSCSYCDSHPNECDAAGW